MALYNVYHIYDEDGGFGDAVSMEQHVATVECTKEEIEEFIKEFDKTEAYDHPYATLECHTIRVEEARTVTMEELRKDPYGDGGWFARQVEGYKKYKKGEEDNGRGIQGDTKMPPEQ